MEREQEVAMQRMCAMSGYRDNAIVCEQVLHLASQLACLLEDSGFELLSCVGAHWCRTLHKASSSLELSRLLCGEWGRVGSWVG